MSIKVTLESDGVVTLDPLTLGKKRKGKTEHKITWEKGSGGESFRFISVHFEDSKAPFSDIKINPNKVTCKDKIKKKSGTHTWDYVVTVEGSDGKHHSSNKTGPSAEGGRGVIRNED